MLSRQHAMSVLELRGEVHTGHRYLRQDFKLWDGRNDQQTDRHSHIQLSGRKEEEIRKRYWRKTASEQEETKQVWCPGWESGHSWRMLLGDQVRWDWKSTLWATVTGYLIKMVPVGSWGWNLGWSREISLEKFLISLPKRNREIK